jgi:Leucine-rich repeat (LRR) protein
MIYSTLFTKEHRKLQRISLNCNKINEISPHVFDSLEKLEFLLLSGNKCINKSFNNHVIPENASIKMELRECHKNYRKLFPTDDESFNVTNILKRMKNATENCANEFAALTDFQRNVEIKL